MLKDFLRMKNVLNLKAFSYILIRIGEEIITPPREGILDGITLQSAIEVLAESGMYVERREISSDLLKRADEILILGTAAQIQFVESWDENTLGSEPGSLCLHLRKEMNKILNSNHRWITQI